jgi:protein phosphatase inhibitor 2
MNDVVMAESSNRATENLKKKPPKGILKASSSFEINDTPQASRKPAHRSPKGTKWDEMNILKTLHPPDKDYGHMKIEEPKTPFERPILDDEVDGLDPEVLAERIQAGASKPPKALASSEEDTDEEAAPEDIARKKMFESKRKAHYNEFLVAKRAMKELAESDEEDDDDEESKKPIVLVDEDSSRANGKGTRGHKMKEQNQKSSLLNTPSKKCRTCGQHASKLSHKERRRAEGKHAQKNPRLPREKSKESTQKKDKSIP